MRFGTCKHALYSLSLLLFAAASLEAQEKSALEEVIVTAQKRSERLQDVPIAISAFSGESLEKRGIEDLEDLQMAVPGLQVGVWNRDTGVLTMRGIGAENNTIGGDPGVTMYVDGHYIQSAANLLQDFLDVDRVEVQRGPQGTLYGRNSMGGNINIITRRPTDELQGMATIDLGNYNKRLIQASVSGPFTDRFRGRLSVSKEKRDGYVKNDQGPDLKDSDYYNVRSTFELDLSEALQATFGGSYFDDKSNLFVRQFAFDPSPRRVSQNGPFDRFNKAKGAWLDFSWQPGAVEFRSLSAYNDTEYGVSQDLGAITPDALVVQSGGTETFTQEFQIVSPSDARLRWVAGLFYYDESSNFTFRIDALPGLFVQAGPADVNMTSIAGYAQGDYSFTDQWEVVAGARYTRDDKDIVRDLLRVEQNGVVLAPGGSEPKASAKWSEWTYKAGLNYHHSKDLLAYVSYSTGFKDGGYNYSAFFSPSYGPEYVDATEVGIKSQWLANRLQVNLSGFYYDYKDKQEVVAVDVSQGVNYIVNAASARVDGVELEVVTQPTEALGIDATLSYLDAKYGDFQAFDLSFPQLGVQDISGNTLPRTSKIKWSLGGQYEWELGGAGSLTARLDYSWTDKVWFNYFNRPTDTIDSYDRMNGRITWQSAAKNWSADLYCQNLKDDMTVTNATTPADGNKEIFLLPPRTYGLKVRYQF